MNFLPGCEIQLFYKRRKEAVVEAFGQDNQGCSDSVVNGIYFALSLKGGKQ
jgi:hypothetical protein